MRPFHPSTWPTAVWILLPLAVGLLYALGYAALAPKPTVADLPPVDAILVERFKDLQALDRASFGPRGAGVRATREMIAANRNVRGLPGVDPTRPIHMILMPRTTRPDSTIAVFPVEDAGAFEGEFKRSDFIERDLTRNAQHLVVRGGWAAVAPNRDDARRIGTGGITAAELGEDQAIAARIPALVEHALSLARNYPWNTLLPALGVQVDALYTRTDDAGAAVPVLAGDERLDLIRRTWAEGRMWTWFDPGRVRIELLPQRGTLAERIASVHAAGPSVEGEGAPPYAPSGAEIELRIAGKGAVGLTAHLLRTCGVPFTIPGDDPLGGLGVIDPDASSLLVWAEPARNSNHAITIGLAARALPDLTAYLPLPADGEEVPLPSDRAWPTLGTSIEGLAAPRGTVARAKAKGGLDLLVFGAGARGVAEGMRSSLAAGLGGAPGSGASGRGAAPPVDEGHVVLAAFLVRADRARLLLGRALKPGGFLAALADADIRGRLTTDGRSVRLEAWATR